MSHSSAVVDVREPTIPLSAPPRPANDTRTYLRGSSLLLSGRGVSLLLNLAVQVLTVRFLSKSDYGAFAYGVSVTAFAASILLLGLDKAVSRFVPIYQERGEHDKAVGTIVVAGTVIWGLGLVAFLALIAFRGMLLGPVVKDPLAFSLLLILAALAPLQAFDSLLQSAMAIYVGARAIFFRRYVMGPGLKLAVVLLVVAASGNVYTMAYGYVVGGVLGIALYLVILMRFWRGADGSSPFRPGRLQLPFREVLGYSIPLVTSEIVGVLPGLLSVVLLERLRATSAVAEFRAVLPVARLNLVILQSFSVLYIPIASRMFARNDREGLNQLYWQTAMWISVLTFPVFVATFCLARPLTLMLFGSAYAQSSSLLAVLALGCYVNAALGFNSYTLRVQGRTRSIVAINAITTVAGAGASVLLISRYGAMGAAVGSTFTLILLNLLNHAGLLIENTGVRLLDWRFVRTYGFITALTLVVLAVDRAFAPPIYVGVAMAALASVVLVRLCRHTLEAGQTFPKLRRIPIVRQLLA